MTHRVAVIADIRPGKRDQLAQLLAGGPPFDLASHGFTDHEAFLGDRDVVFVFEGERTVESVRSLAGSLPISTLGQMGRLVSSPRLLPEGFAWSPAGAVS